MFIVGQARALAGGIPRLALWFAGGRCNSIHHFAARRGREKKPGGFHGVYFYAARMREPYRAHACGANYLRVNSGRIHPSMRHVADIPHPAVKITLLAWNGKFLLKLEQGSLEQTYKVAELDLMTGTDAEVRELLDEEFLALAIDRFQAMRTDLQAAFDRHELR